MSSPYVTLGNRPLEQWKVTELKEELKKRKLTTKGLKEDLLKRLDEAVRIEWANAVEVIDNDDTHSEPPCVQEKTESVVPGKDKEFMDISISVGDKLDAKHEHEIDDHRGSSSATNTTEADLVKGTQDAGLEGQQLETTTVVIDETVKPVATLSGSHLHIVEKNQDGDSTTVLNNDGLQPLLEDAKIELPDPNIQLPQINENIRAVASPSEPNLQGSKTQSEAMHSIALMEVDDSKCFQPDSSVQPLKYQVSEVKPDLGFQVTSDSVSSESVSINEKNELKVDVITDNVQLELDVRHEMVQPPASNAVPVGGELHPMGVEEPLIKKDEQLDKKDVEEKIDKKDEQLDIKIEEPINKKDEPVDKKDVEEPLDKMVSTEVTSGGNAENADSLKNIDSVDLGPTEKLSLDRSSGDDSMEEDILDSKQIEYKSDSNKVSDNVKKIGKPTENEEDHVDVVGHDQPAETKVTNTENETASAQAYAKRKFHDKEAVGYNDSAKKARKWNAEGLKGSEPQSGNIVASVTPRGLSEPSFKHPGTDPAMNEETPKERIVPPSSRPPTNSLRVDRFLRPFTLKAVQELLGKTGTVTGFWMDHIKTHCYVSYSSVEEAVETRNAVYNLQWPPNGGRLLAVEFVDPQEVTTRVEAPPASPATPSSNAAPNFSTSQNQHAMPPQPSPRQQALKQQLPPPSLPPPPLSNPPHVRERPHPTREPLPREPPLPARDRLNLPPPPPLPLPEKNEPPIVTLDDLFRKTKATPRIYYLPLSDEQVAAKLKPQGDNANQ